MLAHLGGALGTWEEPGWEETTVHPPGNQGLPAAHLACPATGVPVPGLWGTGDKQSPCPQTQRCACEWSRQGWKSPEAELGAICLCTCGWWLPGSFLSNVITCQNETPGLSLVGPQNSFFWFYFFSLFFLNRPGFFHCIKLYTESYYLNHFKVHNSVAFSTFTLLGKYLQNFLIFPN